MLNHNVVKSAIKSRRSSREPEALHVINPDNPSEMSSPSGQGLQPAFSAAQKHAREARKMMAASNGISLDMEASQGDKEP